MISACGVANIESDDEFITRFEIAEPQWLPGGGSSADLDCNTQSGPFLIMSECDQLAENNIVAESGDELWKRLIVHPAFNGWSR